MARATRKGPRRPLFQLLPGSFGGESRPSRTLFFSPWGAGLRFALRNETGRKFVKEHRNRDASFCVLHPSPLEVFMTAAVRFVSLAVCFVAFAGCDIVQLVAQSERARGSFERTLTVDGPVDLSVRSGSGGIQIRTGSGDRVQVIGKVSAGSSRDGARPGRAGT